MKIFKNLLGENAKIHGDSIYLESGSNDDGYWVTLPDGLTVVCAQKTITISSAAAGQEVLVTQDFPLRFNTILPTFMTESGALYADGSASPFMTIIKRGGQAFASGYGREYHWQVYMSHENRGSSANRVRFFGLAMGYKD